MDKNRFYLKNVIAMAICLVGMTIFSSCNSEKNNLPAISVADNSSLSQEVFADDVQGKSGVSFTTTGAWTSSISTVLSPQIQTTTNSTDWISISPQSGNAGTHTINIALEKNYTGTDRTAIITILCGGEDIEITITQMGITKNGDTFVIDKNGILTAYIGAGGDVAIPEGVTEIAEQVFVGNSTITSVNIPASVINIGNDAFGLCDNLTHVTFAENSNLQIIGNMAFSYSGITSIEIPVSVITIGNDAFWNCTNLTTVTFVKNSSLQTISDGAFRWSNITSIDIPASITEIGNSAFENCFNLSTVIFSENSNLKTIGSKVFCYSGITSIEIPTSVTTIGESAFEESRLATIIFADNGNLKTIGAMAFRFCGWLSSIEIPNSVTEIGESAFSGCGYLATVTFAKNSNLQTIGSGAFANSSSITSITIPSSVITLGGGAFSECRNLINVTFAENSHLQIIDNQAFYLCGITSIEIPNSTTSIGDWAFTYCMDLKDITVHWANPNTLIYGNEIFYGLTTNETTLYVPIGTADLYRNNLVWNEFDIVEK